MALTTVARAATINIVGAHLMVVTQQDQAFCNDKRYSLLASSTSQAREEGDKAHYVRSRNNHVALLLHLQSLLHSLPMSSRAVTFFVRPYNLALSTILQNLTIISHLARKTNGGLIAFNCPRVCLRVLRIGRSTY